MRWVLIGVGIISALVVAVIAIGLLLPQGHVATREALFTRPAAEIFSVITDVARYGEWRDDVRAVRVLQDEPLRWTEEGAHGAITFEAEEATPPVRFVVRIADPDLPFGGRWIYELDAVAGGTRLVITEEGEVYNPLFRFMSRFVFSHTATIDAYLQHLRRRVATD